ncbi:MAG: UDP-N-acetylglucosamine diphosphorylase [Chlamydiia bacterium]|nr:UDP-N-acetylglucosamine diphosphorylase [Chlamydiia bacterium]
MELCPTHAKVFSHTEFVWDVLNPLGEYLQTLPLGVHESEPDPGAYVIDPQLIYIGPGVTIEPGAYIAGPCYLGAGTVVRHGAYLRGNVITGENCVLGHATEVKNSLFLNHACAPHFAYVGDSVLGNNVNLGAGTRLANFRLDHQEISVMTGEGSYRSGRRKFGAILGDGSQLGCNSVCNPGSILGKGVITLPCTSVSGVVREGCTIRHGVRNKTTAPAEV